MKVITATYNSMSTVKNTVDDLISTGIESEKVYADEEHNQVKVMLPDTIEPEIKEILQRHKPIQLS